jgi:hypothetical protein
MAKRKRKIDIEKRIREGRGKGIGVEYKPWLTIQDVASEGRASRIKGIKTKRKHEFLSDLERDYFYILEFSDVVQDIREQFPLLPLEETVLIAEELGYEHPKDSETGEVVVMTTDFFINIINSNENIEVARTVKPKNKLLDRRIIEKFEIERVFWERKGVLDWSVITEEEIDKTIARNISLIHSYSDISLIDSFDDIEACEIKDLVYEFLKRVIDNPKTLRKISYEFEDEMCLKRGTGISIFKYLVINKIIEIDITQKININRNIPIINIVEASIEKMEAI